MRDDKELIDKVAEQLKSEFIGLITFQANQVARRILTTIADSPYIAERKCGDCGGKKICYGCKHHAGPMGTCMNMKSPLYEIETNYDQSCDEFDCPTCSGTGWEQGHLVVETKYKKKSETCGTCKEANRTKSGLAVIVCGTPLSSRYTATLPKSARKCDVYIAKTYTRSHIITIGEAGRLEPGGEIIFTDTAPDRVDVEKNFIFKFDGRPCRFVPIKKGGE